MRALVKNGTTVWPGAKFIIRPDGKPTDLRFAKENERHLEIGYGNMIACFVCLFVSFFSVTLCRV
jgi:hypothetical protein